MAPPRRAMSAEELRNLRRRCNLTRQQLADYLGVSRSTIARWERAEWIVPVPVALALSQEAVQDDLRAINGVNLPLWQHRAGRRGRRKRRAESVQPRLPE